MPCDRSFSSVICKRLRDTILYDLIGFIQASIPLIMLEIQSYRIGKWFIYLWAKVHISLTNSSYIFDEWFIYLSILEVIGNNAKCIYILEKKYLQMRSEIPANFPLSKKYFSLKSSFFFTVGKIYATGVLWLLLI